MWGACAAPEVSGHVPGGPCSFLNAQPPPVVTAQRAAKAVWLRALEGRGGLVALPLLWLWIRSHLALDPAHGATHGGQVG